MSVHGDFTIRHCAGPNQNLELTLGKISEIYANGDDLQLTRQQYEAWLLPFLLLQE